MWKEIKGYRWPYRINEDACIQKFYNGEWVELHPYICGCRARAVVKMRTADNRKVEIPVVWLMADAFMGGRRPGYNIVHKDGTKLNNAWRNLEFKTKAECGRLTKDVRRRAVEKLDREGNVVALYRSAAEAARRDFISKSSVQQRCAGKVQDPYKMTGYTYRYEENWSGVKRKKKEDGA